MFNQKKIVIAGGSGFIGQEMARRWAGSNQVIILTRGLKGGQNNAFSKEQAANVQNISWDLSPNGSWTTSIRDADVLINLCGRSVNCRYNATNKKAILDSRLKATEALGEAVRKCTRPPKLWINLASATIYRDARDRPQDELTGETHDDFSVQVCKSWEAAFLSQQTLFTRKVVLRSAIVLGQGGAIVPFKRLVLAGVGGQQGNGGQMFSWIHSDDLCRMIEWIADRSEEEGIYNASAPQPVTNQEFMHQLRTAIGAVYGLPLPAWLIRLGAWIVGTETELILKSRWVLPARIMQEGFSFRFPDIRNALENLLGSETDSEARFRQFIKESH